MFGIDEKPLRFEVKSLNVWAWVPFMLCTICAIFHDHLTLLSTSFIIYENGNRKKYFSQSRSEDYIDVKQKISWAVCRLYNYHPHNCHPHNCPDLKIIQIREGKKEPMVPQPPEPAPSYTLRHFRSQKEPYYLPINFYLLYTNKLVLVLEIEEQRGWSNIYDEFIIQVCFMN